MEDNQDKIESEQEEIKDVSQSPEEEFKDFDEEPESEKELELEKDTSLMSEEEIEAKILELQKQFMGDESQNQETAESETEENKEGEEELDESKIEEPEIEEDETKSISSEDENSDIAQEEAEAPKESKAENTEEEKEVSTWEEVNSDNDVVKKYIVYVSKDFVPYIDSLTTDERSAYINDALEKKIELENIDLQAAKKKKILTHLALFIITICIITPFALLGVNKAIMLTFANYKYSQDNFEKLFKDRFEKNKAYARSVEYNREVEKRRAKMQAQYEESKNEKPE